VRDKRLYCSQGPSSTVSGQDFGVAQLKEEMTFLAGVGAQFHSHKKKALTRPWEDVDENLVRLLTDDAEESKYALAGGKF